MAGTYTGPIEKLRGQHAMLRTDPTKPNTVLAQFDDVALVMPDTVNERQLGYGWHSFPAAHFDFDLEL